MAELSLSDVQAVHILDMQLRRLTALAKLELEAEAEELRGRITDYEKILASDKRQRTIVLSELDELVANYGTERRSRIVSPDHLDDVTAEEVEAEAAATRVEEPCVVALSASGMVGREPVDGPKAATFGRHDVLVQRVATTQLRAALGPHEPWPGVPVRGRRVRGGDRAEPGRGGVGPGAAGQGRGGAHPGGRHRPGGEEPPPLLLVTAQGVMKRLTVDELTGTPVGKPAIKLRPADTVVAAFPAPDGTEVVAVASNAQALRTEAALVPVQGRGAGGVAGMKLGDGATVVGAGPVGEDSIVLTVSDAQTAKVTDAAELPTKGRATAGLRITKFRTEKRLEWAYVGPEDGVLLVVGTAGGPHPARPLAGAAHPPAHGPGPGVQGHQAAVPRGRLRPLVNGRTFAGAGVPLRAVRTRERRHPRW